MASCNIAAHIKQEMQAAALAQITASKMPQLACLVPVGYARVLLLVPERTDATWCWPSERRRQNLVRRGMVLVTH